MAHHPLCEQLQISRREVRSLLSYLRLGPDDWRNLERVHEIIDPELNALVASMHQHILSVDHLRHLLSGPGVLDRLSEGLRTYLASLGRNATELDYFEERLHVGFAHEGIGLELRWYLGAYPLITDWIEARLRAELDPRSADHAALVSSVRKVVALDVMLAVETYHHSSTQRLEDVLSEQYLVEHDLRRTTARDELTGVMNRQALLESIEVEFLRSQRFHYPFVLLLIDVDSFRSINERHGHRFGDFVLKRIVELLGVVLRPEDLLGRYGGDQILVGLPHCSEAEAFKIAERIRLKVTVTRIEHDDAYAPVTLSIGLAPLLADAAATEELVARADQAVQQAKRAGRNRTVIWRAEAATGSPPEATGQAGGQSG